MPVFRFRGFSTGTPVEVSASQGASSDGRAVSAWGVQQPTPISLSLGATRLTGTAPMGVIFTATATSPAARVVSPFHDIECVWSFDDPGTFSILDNAPIWGADRNVAYGPVATHVFEAPGTYVVTCTAHDGENPPRSETITIEVAAANDVFAGANTAVVSAAGNFAEAPAGASQHTSIAAALSALSSRHNRRLLLRRGETYTDTVTFSASGGSGRKMMVGAFGTGANPLFDRPGSASYAVTFSVAEGAADELMVRDIDYVGEFDPRLTGQPARTGGGVNFAPATEPLTAHKTIWSCHFRNSGDQTLSISTSNDIRNVYVGNCWFDGWRNYGILVSDGGYIGICGSKIMQPAGARNGPGKDNDWPDHGPLRVSRPTGPMILSNVDFTSFNDWSTGSNYSMQPVTRWNAGVGEDTADRAFVVDRFRGEGGPLRTYNFTTNLVRRDVFAIVDRFYTVLTSHQNIGLYHGGCTYRNGVVVRPNTRSGGGTGLQGGLLLDDITADGARRSEVYSCAFIDLADDANSQNRAGTSGPRPFTMPSSATNSTYFGNNLGHAPNRSSVPGFTAHDPLDTADGAWSPTYAGEAYEAGPLDTSRAYGREAVATFRPLPGSAAIGGATGKVSLLDFDGTLRSEVLAGLARSAPSIGPYEPDLEG